MDRLSLDQLDFHGRLQADPFFADVAILLEEKGVTEADIAQALAGLNSSSSGKIGACVIVLAPELSAETPNLPGPCYDIAMTVQVIEQPLVNRAEGGSGITAAQLAERVRQLFHHFFTGDGSVYNFTKMQPLPQAAGQVSYGVRFERGSGDARVDEVVRPEIVTTGDGPVIATITCATPGAAIYYTLDGSYPRAGSEHATLYAGPVSIEEACTLRAAAELAGLLPSSLAIAEISIA